MYAIVKTGGKQYRVEAGRTLNVDLLPVGAGDTVELRDVLLIAEDGDVTVGTPTIDGARVVAHVEQHGRGEKIVVLKYKSKVRSRKKTGHRQGFTRLTVQEILRPGEEAKVSVPTPADGNLDTEDEAAEAIVATGKQARRTRVVAPKVAKPAKAPAPKRPARATVKVEKPAAKSTAARPAAKPKAAPKAKAAEEKKPARRLPLRRKKETE
jgi:large subunit ribosomal protein L21